MVFRYVVIATVFGWVGAVGSKKGLVFLTLPKSSRRAVLSELEAFTSDSIEDPSSFGDLPNRLKSYFNGERVTFTDRLDFSGATAFQQAVWNVTRTIPYGQTRSYAWVASQAESPRALRAVGGSLARNRFPIIVPCHRVVANDGSLGGFSGGLVLKKRLLELEAAQM
jgi:methylated-DNA-[protein]-cysteine S-methyltransferase